METTPAPDLGMGTKKISNAGQVPTPDPAPVEDITDATTFTSHVLGPECFYAKLEGAAYVITGREHLDVEPVGCDEDSPVVLTISPDRGEVVITGRVHALVVSQIDGRLFAHVYNLLGKPLDSDTPAIGMAYDSTVMTNEGIAESNRPYELLLTGQEEM